MSSVLKKIIYLAVLVEACGIVNCSMRTLSLGTRNLVYWPGIESSPSALGAWSLSLWTTGEIPNQSFFRIFFPGSPPGYLLKHLEKFCFGLSFWRPWIMSLIRKISLLMSWIYLVIYLFGLINPQGLNFSLDKTLTYCEDCKTWFSTKCNFLFTLILHNHTGSPLHVSTHRHTHSHTLLCAHNFFLFSLARNF